MRRMQLEAACSILILVLAPAIAGAQSTGTMIVADGSLGTVVEQSGQTFIVTGGTLVGRNLFHSFRTCDVGRDGGVAIRTGGAEIDNVIIRVTGEEPSQIEESVGVDAVDDEEMARRTVFFFNPASAEFRIFEAGGIPGKFYTSAQRLHFADGTVFSPVSIPQELTAAAPTAFEFRGGVRGDLTGEVRGDLTDEAIEFDGGDIALVDEHVLTNRNIKVHGRSLTLDRSSLAVSRGGLPRGPLRIDVDRGVDVINGSSISANQSGQAHPIQIRARVISILASRIMGFSGGFGGSREDLVLLEARAIRLGEGSEIDWSTSEGNPVQAVRMVASQRVLIDGESRIATDGSFAPPPPIVIEDRDGPGGSLEVELREGSEIHPIWGNGGGASSTGIKIRAHTLRLDDASLSTERGAGPRDIDLDLERLLLSSGARLSTRGGGIRGGSGAMHIDARDLVSLVDSEFDARVDTGGPAGRILISGSPVVRLDRARIDASGVVGGGEIALGSAEARLRTTVLNASTIDASSVEGDGGAIAIYTDVFRASPDSSLNATGATSYGTITIDSSRTRGH